MRSWPSRQGVVKEVTFTARKLIFGAVGDIGDPIGVPEEEVYQMFQEGGKDRLDLMGKEIQEHGSAEECANWRYSGGPCQETPCLPPGYWVPWVSTVFSQENVEVPRSKID